MSAPAKTDPAPPAEPTDPPAPPADPPAEPADPPADLGDAGKKALEAERQARKAAEAAAREAQKKVKEYEDRDKSEAEKAQERAEAAEKRAADLELENSRIMVAVEKGLTPAQAKRLVGSTREELEADAEQLLKDFPAPTGDGPRRPAPDPSQGVKPQSVGNDALIAEARAKGDYRTVIALENQKLNK